MVQLLDVTLRDGGNRIDFHFTPADLEHILPPLDQSGIDYIEIGYRNGAIHPIADLGMAGMCAKEYVLACRALIQRARLAVMVHPHLITQSDLLELRECGVCLIRICILRGRLTEACPWIAMAKQLGFMVSVNFIHASQYTNLDLDNAVEQVSAFTPDIIYFADSNGSLLPSRVQGIYETYTQRYDIPFGFHAHDNLGLAQANTIAAVQAGAEYVDAALAGMGKGIGNLRTEFYLAYLKAMQIGAYEFQKTLPAANYIRRKFHMSNEALPLEEFIRGISDLSTAEVKQRICQLS